MNARRAAPAIALLVLTACIGALSLDRAPVDAPASWASDPAWLVDLDAAPPAELALLPRIGPTLAKRIVEERQANGPFESLDDLAQRTRGIGPRTIERIAPFVRFDDDAAQRAP